MNAIFNRFELITILLKDNNLDESYREFIAKMKDEMLLTVYGKVQFKTIRKGFYTI